jgi:hypothetical protein
MPELLSKEPYVRQSISFPRRVLAELKEVVVVEERHGNLSRYIQDLVFADLERRRQERARSEREADVA